MVPAGLIGDGPLCKPGPTTLLYTLVAPTQRGENQELTPPGSVPGPFRRSGHCIRAGQEHGGCECGSALIRMDTFESGRHQPADAGKMHFQTSWAFSVYSYFSAYGWQLCLDLSFLITQQGLEVKLMQHEMLEQAGEIWGLAALRLPFFRLKDFHSWNKCSSLTHLLHWPCREAMVSLWREAAP